MKKVILIVVAVIVVLGLIFLVIQGFGKKKGGPDVRTATVERGDISRTVVATGKIEPLYKAEIKSKIGGLVNRFFVEAGDRVEAGQKLVEIIPGATPMELVQARNEVKAAAYDKERAERVYLRAKELRENNMMSLEDYEDALAVYKTARTRFYSAMAQLQVLERGSNISSLEGQIELTEEDRKEIAKEAKEALASMTVLSPISGIVLSRDTDKGSSVIPLSSAYGGTVLMTIADISEMHFRGDVDEADIGKVHLGLPVRIYVESYPGTKFEGQLTRISPLGREKDNIVNFEIRAKIKDPEGKLRVGMSADAELILEEHKNTLTIPEGAIVYEDEKAFVYVQDPSIPEGKRKIEIKRGISDGIKTEVLSGLKEGDVIVMPE